MEIEIKQIIEKNLPAQVGDVLKLRLDQADKDAARLKAIEDQLVKRNEFASQLEAQISEYKKFDSRNAAIDARELAVSNSERDLKVKELQYQLESEKEKTAYTKEVALGLVRNTEYRKSILDSEIQNGYFNGATWVQPSPIAKSLTESNKAE